MTLNAPYYSMTEPYNDHWAIISCGQDWKRYGYNLNGLFQAKEPIDIANYLINTEAGQSWIFDNLLEDGLGPSIFLSPMKDERLGIDNSRIHQFYRPVGECLINVKVPKEGKAWYNWVHEDLTVDQAKAIIIEAYRKDPQSLLNDLSPPNSHFRILNAQREKLFLEAMYDGADTHMYRGPDFMTLEAILEAHPVQVVTSPSA